MAELWLESHCRSRPAPPAFAPDFGFCHVEWLDQDAAFRQTPPLVGEVALARVTAPFFADAEREILTLHRPPAIAANGWEPDDGNQLSGVRLVACRLMSVGDETSVFGRPARMLELLPTRVFDPIDVSGEPVPTDLVGTLLDPRPREKQVLWGTDRVRVENTMEGDVTFTFWLRRSRPEIFLLEDTSICQGYFYSGNGLLGETLYAKLLASE